MARKRIGELLLERGVISKQQLEEGLSHHRATRQRLGVALIQKGFVTEQQLCQVLSDALGIPLVDLPKTTPEPAAVQMLRPRFCESNDLFPFAALSQKGRKQLLVAMSDPLNLPAIEEMEFTTGLKVQPRLAPLSSIRSAILRHYHRVQIDDSPSSKMTLIQRGGGSRVVETDAEESTQQGPPLADRAPPGDEEDSVIVGEELTPVPETSGRTALAELMRQRQAQSQERRARRNTPVDGASDQERGLAQDLHYLFGGTEGSEGVEGLERKFWALMRLMAKKGLLTRDEFLQELDEE